MKKRTKILNDCISLASTVENPSKNLPSHMAMRIYADEFAKWCFKMGAHLSYDNLYIINGEKYSVEDMLELFDPTNGSELEK